MILARRLVTSVCALIGSSFLWFIDNVLICDRDRDAHEKTPKEHHHESLLPYYLTAVKEARSSCSYKLTFPLTP
jgi:hypothetical protein